MAGLLVTVVQYYRVKLASPGSLENKMQTTTSRLQPPATMLKLEGDFYAHQVYFSSEK